MLHFKFFRFIFALSKERIMIKTIKIALFIALVCVLPSVAFAQVTRVAIENPHNQKNNYIDVYEFDYVEHQPQFPGGDRAMFNFINKERVYPYEAYQNRIQGRVICSFIVNTDGSICNISVLKGAHPLLNREAVRIIMEMPNWKPGMMHGSEVAVRCILPIAFRL